MRRRHLHAVGVVIVDVVRWREHGTGCNRCGVVAAYYVIPYWRPSQRVCPACCRELNRFHDGHGWPDDGRHDI